MSPEEFRRHGHKVVDWIADYLAHPERYPVLAQVSPGYLLDQLPASGPEQGEPMEEILGDFQKFVIPGMTHWNHPSFFAYFSISGSGPGILGEIDVLVQRLARNARSRMVRQHRQRQHNLT